MSTPLLKADPILCRCFRVTESTVENCVTLLGATHVREVREACGAGGGCMGCRRRIQAFIDERRQLGAMPHRTPFESVSTTTDIE
ncbi:(2Fe-2S)-binding protein [Planctomicrobium sp. SH668]|uniref:(2Fe-2S)-binding protein n=1 Tax=Planctomicrobium sp. SH668 TaxID=3448126 RepID=UPI003F5C1B8C